MSGVDEVIHLSADVPVKLCGAATVKQDNDACEFSGIIVHDASTMEDLAAIAERLEKADELYVTGGCAGFLEVYPMEASRDTKEALPALKERLFVLSGSVNDVTRKHRRRSYSGSSDSIPSLRKSTASCSSRIHRIPAGGIKRKTKSRGSLALRIKLETKSRRRLAGSIKQKKRSRRKLVFLVRCFAYLPKSKGQHWPLNANEQNDWTKTITYWLHYNAIDGPKFTDTPTGLLASESFYEEERFFHQIFKDSTGEPMYYFITVARMAHAVDPREIRIGWEFCQANVHLFCCMNFNCSNIKHQFF